MYIRTPAKPAQQLVAPLQVKCQISANLWKKKCNITKCQIQVKTNPSRQKKIQRTKCRIFNISEPGGKTVNWRNFTKCRM